MSLQELKKRLTLVHVLVLPTEGKEYDLYIDISHYGLGVMLMQRGKVITLIK